MFRLKGKVFSTQIVFFAMFIGLTTNANLFAQNSNDDLVFKLYLESVLQPEKFDRYVKDHPYRFDASFWKCFNRLQKRVQIESQRKSQICNSYSDPFWRQKCNAENHANTVWMWTIGFKSVYDGSSKWKNTMIGNMTLLGKRQVEALMGSRFYKQSIEMVAPLMRIFLLCE